MHSNSTTVSTIIRNAEPVTTYALAAVNMIAGAGLTGGGDLSADRTFSVGSGFGLTVAADTVAVDQGMVPTWTGIHTFSAQDVHDAGVSLGTSGATVSNVVTGALAKAFDFQDSQSRSGANELSFSLRNTSLTKNLMQVTWDGRFGFGYTANNIPQSRHVLSFLQQDTDSPAGSPHQVGILGLINHNTTAQTTTYGYGVAGAYSMGAATTLSATIYGGVHGGFGSGVNVSTAGIVAAGVSSSFWNAATTGGGVGLEPAHFDGVAVKTGLILAGSYEHLTGFWANLYGSSVALTAPTNYPVRVSSARFPIQAYPASFTAGSPLGENWALYGEAPTTGHNASGGVVNIIAHYPAITGFMRVPYPRFTGGTGVNAKQLYWEPWDHKTATGRANAIDGDTYFSDGTTNRKGLWEYAGAWYKLLQHTSVDAISGAVGPATLAVTTGGATGPTVAAQNTWLQVVGANGTPYWVPAWV